MAVLRPHLALNVTDIERSARFYATLFGVEPSVTHEDYAKFEIIEPALNLTLNLGCRNGDAETSALNHAGIQVDSNEDVLAAKQRMVDAGLATFDESEVECCYHRQDKIWVTAPDGESWEIFATLGASEERGEPVAPRACR